MTFEQANSKLIGRCSQRRKVANHTYLERRDGGNIAVKLHDTDVVTFWPDGAVILDSGGWRTVTTKDRMNSYSGRHIWTERGVWYVGGGYDRGKAVVYADGITFYPDGRVEGAGAPVANLSALKRRIKKYVDGFMAAFDAGEVPPPSNGDCWGCLMRADNGTYPMGGTDHVMSHMEESYYVPSLLARAIDRFPVSQAARAYISDKWAGTDNGAWCTRIGREQISKSIRRLVNAELGMQV